MSHHTWLMWYWELRLGLLMLGKHSTNENTSLIPKKVVYSEPNISEYGPRNVDQGCGLHEMFSLVSDI